MPIAGVVRWLGAAALLCAAGGCGSKVTHTSTTSGTDSGTGGSASGGTGGGTGGGAGGGTGGAGGGVVPAGCAVSTAGTTPLVEVATPAGDIECIEATEVTRGLYEIWLNEGGVPSGLPVECGFNVEYAPVADWPPGGVGLDRPVAHIDWCDALAYCLDHNRRLCGRIGGGSLPPSSSEDASESEWFNACSSQGQRIFPYGQDHEPTTCNGSELGLSGTTDVGSLPGCVDATSGVFDLSGNVWEWEDSCDSDTGASDDCNIRGGAYNNNESSLGCGASATAMRAGTAVNVGFRCCADPLQ